MNDEIRTSERDKELTKRLADTLDNSIDALDAETCAQLTALRHAALTRNTEARNSKRRVAGGFALAASIVALALVPWSLHRESMGNGVIENDSGDMAYLSIDPQMLDDIDMLQSLNELQDGVSTQSAS